MKKAVFSPSLFVLFPLILLLVLSGCGEASAPKAEPAREEAVAEALPEPLPEPLLEPLPEPPAEPGPPLAWTVKDGTAILLGMGEYTGEELIVPQRVCLSPANAGGLAVSPASLTAQGFFPGLGDGYYLLDEDGVEIRDLSALGAEPRTLVTLVVTDKKVLRRDMSAGAFPEARYLTPEGTPVTRDTVGGVVMSTEISEDTPLLLTLLPLRDLYVEDTENGTSYPVAVSGDAFYGCEQLRRVTFAEGSSVLGNRMNREGRGMFEGCPALEEVLGIPPTVKDMRRAFSGCVSMVRTPEIPGSVTDMSGCFSGCGALREVSPLSPSLSSVNDCFRDCVSLEEGPEIPDGVVSANGCFSGCTALRVPPRLGGRIKDMEACFLGCAALREPPVLPATAGDLDRCFSGCTLLSTAPALPDGLVSLDRCFENCVSLAAAPRLPEGLDSFDGCFAGCGGLQSSAPIPARLVESCSQDLLSAFQGCSGLEELQIEYCGSFPSVLLRSSVPITPLYEHVADGICRHCHIANLQTEVRGITVVADHFREESYETALRFLEDTAPEAFLINCQKITLTNDLRQYYDGPDNPNWQGYTIGVGSSAEVYVKDMANQPYLTNVLAHELAHTMDYYYGISESGEWKALFEKESRLLLARYSNTINYYSEEQQLAESVAIAFSHYYTEPGWLRESCPGIYAYIESFFEH